MLGGHYMIPIGTSGLHFVPSAEVAFGDDAFTHLRQRRPGLPLLGRRQRQAVPRRRRLVRQLDPDDETVDGVTIEGESETDAAFTALGGAWFNATGSTPWFIEGKFGLDDKTRRT